MKSISLLRWIGIPNITRQSVKQDICSKCSKIRGSTECSRKRKRLCRTRKELVQIKGTHRFGYIRKMFTPNYD